MRKNEKRLAVKKETLRQIDLDQLARVVGGGQPDLVGKPAMSDASGASVAGSVRC